MFYYVTLCMRFQTCVNTLVCTHSHTHTHTHQVKLIPRSGLLGQLIVFDFESFLMVRGLAVHVLTEQELRLAELSETRVNKRPPKP